MKVGIIGTGRYARTRQNALEAMATVSQVVTLGDSVAAADRQLDSVDAVFVTGPTGDHFRRAEAVAKQGVHVFLEWPPATSITECQAIVGLAEEARVEVGVSRPYRFHPVFDVLEAAGRASLIILNVQVEASQYVWPRWLAEAIDLCCALAQSHSVQRIDAEAVRDGAVWPEAVAFAFRFHSGAYAQVNIRRVAGSPTGALYVAGAGFQIEETLRLESTSSSNLEENEEEEAAFEGRATLIQAETHAFLKALATPSPVPVSILDGLHTMRLVERLMKKLR